MATNHMTCTECGQEFTSRSRRTICNDCLDKMLLGYSVSERQAEEHTEVYYGKTFKEMNANLIEDCRRAKACGKSYGYYKADMRSIHRRARRP